MDDNYSSSIDEVNGSYEVSQSITDIEGSDSYSEASIKLVSTINGVRYCFDLGGISPEMTLSTLDSFEQKVILITGSNDINISFDSLGDALVNKAKHLILLGQTAGLIEISLMQKLVGKNRGINIRITRCSTLKQAVDCAYLSAKAGDVILLSPAGKKLDMFSSFEEMGDAFEKYLSTI